MDEEKHFLGIKNVHKTYIWKKQQPKDTVKTEFV